MLKLTFLGRGLDFGSLIGTVRRLSLGEQTVTAQRLPAPEGIVKIVLIVPEDVADAVNRIVLERYPHATRAPDPDLDADGYEAVEAAIREARARGEDPGEAELHAASAWWRQGGGQE
jgi:hypothetical protein